MVLGLQSSICFNSKQSCIEVRGRCTSHLPGLPGLQAGARYAGSGLQGHRCVPGISGSVHVTSTVEPSLPCWEEKDLSMGILAPARWQCCQTLWQAVPSEDLILAWLPWLISCALRPTLACRPWCRVYYLLGRQLGIAKTTPGGGDIVRVRVGCPPPSAAVTQLLPPLLPGPAPRWLPLWSMGGPSPLGARLLAAVPGCSWNEIPSIPGRVHGIRILPALSLAPAGKLVTWPCA